MMARSLMGTSLAFHIIFATLGVGIPLMIIMAEILYHFRKDSDYALLAKRWTKAFGIILGVAIPSGTIVGAMLSLLWPGFMEVVGQVIALPFQIEIWAFFLESLFMAIYLYAADRLPAVLRIMSVIFVAIGATASAILITDAHAFMNTPTGFRLENGKLFDIHPWEAVFNPSFRITAMHVVVTAYMTGAFAIVAMAAFKLLRKGISEREQVYHRKALRMGLVMGTVMAVLTMVNGHETAQMLHHYLPEKLAAAEGLFETTTHAPLTIGGFTDEKTQSVKWGIELPGMLSFLAGNRFDTEVKGLNDFPRENWPPLMIHTLFNGMVGIGSLLLVLGAAGILHLWLRKQHFPKWVLQIFVVTGPLAMLGIETGWIFACTGRQPWIIYHVQRTKDAAVHSNSLGVLFALFVGLYVFLLLLTIFVMRFYFRRHPVSKEIQG